MAKPAPAQPPLPPKELMTGVGVPDLDIVPRYLLSGQGLKLTVVELLGPDRDDGLDEDLDDTLCAGYLAAQLRRRLPGAQLGGGALFALSLLRAFPSPVSALWQSRSGHHLRRFDLTGDLAVGSLVSQTGAVPRLVERSEDLYLFTAASPAD